MNLKRIDGLEFPDGKDGRLYFDPSNPPPDGPVFPSVTTILNRREDPGKDRAIHYWKQNNDGKNGNPDHRHIWQYSGPRGTIVHFYILSHLTNGLGGAEEEAALAKIQQWDTDYPFVYSIATNHNGTIELPPQHQYEEQLAESSSPIDGPPTLTQILWEDAHWCLSAFLDLTPRLGLSSVGYTESDCETIEAYCERHLRTENVIDAEVFTHHSDHHYAGQFDCLFERPNGDVVLMDLKTTSGVYYKHKAQLEAYARTIDREIDEYEVVRLQPDKKETQISRLSRWSESRDELWSDFTALNEEVQSMVSEMDVDVSEHEPYAEIK